MESNIRTMGLLITLIFTIYALKKGGELPAIAIIIFAPLTYFSQNIGIVLTPAKLMGILFLGFIIYNPKYLSFLNAKYFKLFKYYYIYSIFITLVMMSFWPEYSTYKQGVFYGNSVRGFVQVFQNLLGISIILFMFASITSIYTLYRMQIALLLSTIFISVYGLYVWIAQQTGLPFNPITRQGGANSTLNYVIITRINELEIVRAYSLTGEPKSLAVNACFGSAITIFTPVFKSSKLSQFISKMSVLALFLITLYLTYSTAGYMILPMVMFVGFVIYFSTNQLTTNAVAGGFFMFLVAITALYISEYDLFSKISSIFQNRVSDRLNTTGLFTYAETSMLKFWSDQPQFAFTGVGLGGSSFYIRLYETGSYSGFIASARGIIGFVADKGIIGLILFSMGMLMCLKPMMRVAVSNSPYRRVFAGVLVICGINSIFIFTYALWPIEWITVGLACAGATLAEKEILGQTHAPTPPVQKQQTYLS